MDSVFFVDASPRVFGKEDWALAVGGGKVKVTGSKSSSTWGEGLVSGTNNTNSKYVVPKKTGLRSYKG